MWACEKRRRVAGVENDGIREIGKSIHCFKDLFSDDQDSRMFCDRSFFFFFFPSLFLLLLEKLLFGKGGRNFKVF